jgi:hypothetical protein
VRDPKKIGSEKLERTKEGKKRKRIHERKWKKERKKKECERIVKNKRKIKTSQHSLFNFKKCSLFRKKR